MPQNTLKVTGSLLSVRIYLVIYLSIYFSKPRGCLKAAGVVPGSNATGVVADSILRIDCIPKGCPLEAEPDLKGFS